LQKKYKKEFEEVNNPERKLSFKVQVLKQSVQPDFFQKIKCIKISEGLYLNLYKKVAEIQRRIYVFIH